jgi:glycosyltransferase involved in cell wall biosynthesis
VKISVIIPYFNRKQHLLLTLEQLLKQRPVQGDFGILVIDDGSLISIEERNLSSKIRWFRTTHQGAASARNIGISEAKGDIYVFIDCDILVGPDFIDNHIDFHKNNPNTVAVGLRYNLLENGLSREDSRKKILDRYGFSCVSFLKHPWFMSYTCHVSIPATKDKQERFDPFFVFWGLEDVEWAYRLYKRSFDFKLIQGALAWHQYHDRNLGKGDQIYVKSKDGMYIFDQLDFRSVYQGEKQIVLRKKLPSL